jgi:hypothetical protein
MEVLPVFLKPGHSVNFEGFDTFLVSVTSEGDATAKELNACLVKGVKLFFLPIVGLKRRLEGVMFKAPPDVPETLSA